MPLAERLLSLLACPQCKGGMKEVDAGKGLLCERCKLKYQVQSGIPILVSAEAIDLRGGAAQAQGSSVKLPRVGFRVTEGRDAGMTFQLEQGTCRAIGRAGVDPDRTAVFSVDIAHALDEGTKSLILQYIGKQFARKAGGLERPAKDKLGSFRRTSDVVMTDPSLSRLHAMVFSDGENVAVLDLVSKNGTYVNGQEVESQMLEKGDVVELGDTVMVFEK
jgi:uncharacterized protein YbaR (Trm112 family)